MENSPWGAELFQKAASGVTAPRPDPVLGDVESYTISSVKAAILALARLL